MKAVQLHDALDLRGEHIERRGLIAPLSAIKSMLLQFGEVLEPFDQSPDACKRPVARRSDKLKAVIRVRRLTPRTACSLECAAPLQFNILHVPPALWSLQIWACLKPRRGVKRRSI